MSEIKRILYAEDDPDIQAVAMIALEAVGGFELMVCDNGQEAVDNALAFAPDLLLFDVMMPILDGPSALRAIREIPQLLETPAIFMTAKVQTNEVSGYKEMGVIDVIVKPFDPMTLSDQIRDILKRD